MFGFMCRNTCREQDLEHSITHNYELKKGVDCTLHTANKRNRQTLTEEASISMYNKGRSSDPDISSFHLEICKLFTTLGGA